MHRNKSVDTHQFAMVPSADVPRSKFRVQHTHKTTFDAGKLIPIYLDEVLPGDAIKLRMTAFARMATPLYPLMDNLHLDSFFFFVPNRLVWSNWQKFMGEQATPGSSISYTVPIMTCPANGYTIGSLSDYMGLPTVGQVNPGSGTNITHIALFHRAYALIWNQWFKDENIQSDLTIDLGDGPDTTTNTTLQSRGKRHDYFTSALPNPQKGGTSISIPLGTSADIFADSAAVGTPLAVRVGAGGAIRSMGAAATYVDRTANADTTANLLRADLSTATAATINQLRQSFQIQKFLERDARGGTRYTEILRSHFRVTSPDARLQRPEYLGGGTSRITVNPIAQTGQTGLTGGSTPMGTLAAMATALAGGHGFSQSFTEHGMIIGLVSVRADLTYQQGLRKMWSRSTRYDYYWPVFSHLGEQAVYSREIYCDGQAGDANVFGYQERHAEYRYHPSMITSLFRSTASGTIDPWHAAQKFTTRPTLDNTFITDTPPISRLVAVGAAANGQQFICDTFFDATMTRPMPMYGVPGLIDHF